MRDTADSSAVVLRRDIHAMYLLDASVQMDQPSICTTSEDILFLYQA